MQIDTENKEELIEFAGRCYAETQSALFYKASVSAYNNTPQEEREAESIDRIYLLLKETSVLEYRNWISDTFSVPFDVPNSKHESAGDAILTFLTAACLLVKQILDGLCDTDLVDMACLDTLREYIGGTGNTLARNFKAINELTLENGGNTPYNLPLSCFQMASKDYAKRPDWIVSDEFERLFVQIWQHKVSLRRCQECNSVFIVARADQKYCSHRCSNRVSQRKRDQRKRDLPIDWVAAEEAVLQKRADKKNL